MLGLLLILSAAPSPFKSAEFIEPIGWSADESRVALRVFYGGETFDLEPCPGYVGADGKPFRGGLALVVLEGGKLKQTFVIQRPRDEDAQQRCTGVAAARDALARAKQAMDELGIIRDNAGSEAVTLTHSQGKPKVSSQKREDQTLTRSDWQDTWSNAEAALQLSARDLCDDDGYCERSLSATLLGPEPAPRKVLAQQTLPSERWNHNAAGSLSMGFALIRSPSHKVLLPLLFLTRFRMEGTWSTCHFLGPVAVGPAVPPTSKEGR